MCETAESFMKRLNDMVQSSYTTAAIAVGVDLNLFDDMAKLDGPKTSQQIADASGCKERYIREWLNTLVVGGIVTYNAQDQTYFLQKHRTAALSGNNPNSPALMTVLIPFLNVNYKKVTDCFRKEGPEGVDPDDYPGITDFFRRVADQYNTAEAMDRIISQVPGLKEKLESGIAVCEAGVGRAQFLMMLAERFPKSQMTGFDTDDKQITQNVQEARQRGLKNILFSKQDIHNLPADWENKWDYLCSSNVIHDLPYPGKALKELYKICKPGGYFSQIDVNLHSNVAQNIDSDFGPYAYCASMFYCMPISLYFKDGTGLGAAWGKELAAEMTEAAGFEVTMHAEKESFHAVCKK